MSAGELEEDCYLQDYRVHIKHTDGHYEHVPYFSLPANDLTDVIAPSCYSCFDYPNALADLVCLLCLVTSHKSQIIGRQLHLMLYGNLCHPRICRPILTLAADFSMGMQLIQP